MKLFAKIVFFLFCLSLLSTLTAQNELNFSSTNTKKLIENSQSNELSDSTKLQVFLELTYRYSEQNLDTASLFGFKALNLAIKTKDKERAAQSHEYLGRIYKGKSLVDSAIFHLDQALQNSQRLKILMSVFLQKSSIYQFSGQYDKALQALLSMDSIAKIEKNLDFQGKATASIGELWRVRDQPEKALNYLEKAAQLFQEINNINNYLWVMGRISSCHRDRGNLAQGIKTMQTILQEKYRPNLTKNNLALNHNTLAHLYADTGELDKAEKHFKQSIAFSKEIGKDYFIQNGMMALVDIYAAQQKFKQAITIGKEALQLCEEGKDFRNLLNLHMNLSNVYEQVDSLEQSLFHLYQHLAFKDSLLNIEKIKITEELEKQYENARQADALKLKEQDLQLAANQRNLVILGSLFLFGMLGFVFWRRNEKKKKEAALLLAKTQELKRLDELKSKFFANISHELRTPLTLIWGPINALLKQDQKRDTVTLTNPLQVIKNNCQRLMELVNEILDLSKLEANKMDLTLAEIPLYPFLQRIASAFQSAAEIKEIDFKINILLSETLVVKTDQKKLEKIFNNLISNALKFTPPKGEIIFVADQKDNGNFQFKVKDNGRGIHSEDLPHIFNRYFQSQHKDTPSEGGTGIGLSLSNELAVLLGGNLKVKSEWKKGSTFTLELPKSMVAKNPTVISSEQVFSTQKPQLPIQTTLESPKREESIFNPALEDATTILIVEDNLEMQDFLIDILKKDYQIMLANNGKEALNQLSNPTFQPDLILSDVMMPEMDGFTLLQELKKDENLLHLPVLMLTARADMRDKLKALNIGVDDYMAKPFEEEELKIRIKNLINNSKERRAIKTTRNKQKNTKIRQADLIWLKDVEEVLHREVNNSNFTLLSLADEMAISKSQLFRRIKLLTGLTPNKYFREIKLNSAKERLEDQTYATMAEVSYAVGFDDPQYFSRIYFERYGKKPSSYF